MMNERVVVTGIGLVTSIGTGKDIFWQNLLSGKSGVSEVDAFDTSNHANHYGCQIKDFNPAQFMNKKKIKLLGRASQFAIAATRMAIEDSKLAIKDSDTSRIAFLIGTTSGEIQEMERIDVLWVKDGEDSVTNWPIVRYPVNNIPSNVASEFKIKGINRIFTTACAAGNYAIGYGFDLIQLGKADKIICGGSDVFSYISFTGFSQLFAMAPKMCQPFDKNRKGMLLGEGAGIMILETLEAALDRNAPIYAQVLGYGLSCDASHMTNPNVKGVTQCMKDALLRTGIVPSDIDYICSHGTGTKLNDKTECAAIKKIFDQKRIPVNSLKSMLGHSMGAASAIEAIACCLSVKNDIIPPTINFQTPDPECDVDCVPNQARKQVVNIVLNNGFAFGGNNSCLVIKKFTGNI